MLLCCASAQAVYLCAAALMVAMPLVMGAALSQHNNIIRKAAWMHFGYIIGWLVSRCIKCI
jgi:hypothetical protein